MTPAVEQAMIRKDAAGRNQVFDQLRIRRPGRGGRRLRNNVCTQKPDDCGRG
jgi:hypothetical protein